MISILLYSVTSEGAYNAYEIAEGNWTITLLKLNKEGREIDEETKVFNATILNAGANNSLEAMFENCDQCVEFEMLVYSNTSFSTRIKYDNKEYMNKFNMSLTDDMFMVYADYDNQTDSTITINVLSLAVIEISIFNHKTKEISLLRLKKNVIRKQKYEKIWMVPLLFSVGFFIFLRVRAFLNKNIEIPGAGDSKADKTKDKKND